MNETEQWPILRAAQDFVCDGVNPRSGGKCLLGEHRGYHRDDAGDEWLDDGDPARPDWLNKPYDPRD